MRELIVDADVNDKYFIDHIYDKILPSVKSVGGLCVVAEANERSCLGIVVADECASALNRELKALVAEVLAVGFKCRYLQERIAVNADTLLGKTLFNTMCVFDSNYDANYIKRRIYDYEKISLDGCYNFRIGEIKQKWDEVINLSNSYSGFLADKEVLYEFLVYLLEAIPSLADCITVVISDDGKNFVLFNDDGKMLVKFNTYYKQYDIDEQIIFNLICFNPAVVKLCGKYKLLGNDFFNIANRLFQVKEYIG